MKTLTLDNLAKDNDGNMELTEVNITNKKCDKKQSGRIPFLRQMFIASGVWTFAFMFGLSFGTPTVAIPQLKRESNASDIDIHVESWLSSTMLFSGIPWVLILTILVFVIGRRRTFLIISITSLIGYIIAYIGATVTSIFICQIIQGPLAVCQMTTSFLVEYISPKYRGVFCTIQVGTMYWGIWLSNAIGTFSHWKGISLFGIICATYNVINVFLWPESPYWLLMKGKYNECIQSHRWLKGSNKRSEKELEELLKMRKKETSVINSSFIREHTRDFFRVLLLPDVYRPSALCLLTITMYHLSGKVVYTIYSLDIIKRITINDNTAYKGMLILDGITVVSMYLGCFVMVILTRRTLLLVTSLLTSIFLISLSLYVYLIKISVITEIVYVTIALLILFSLVVSIGPLCVNGVLLGELMPLKSRSVFVFIFTLYGKCLVAVMIKVSPYLFEYLNIHGSFLFYGVCTFVCVCLVYKYLPETKGKTLIEISESFRRQDFVDESKELMPMRRTDFENAD